MQNTRPIVGMQVPSLEYSVSGVCPPNLSTKNEIEVGGKEGN